MKFFDPESEIFKRYSTLNTTFLFNITLTVSMENLHFLQPPHILVSDPAHVLLTARMTFTAQHTHVSVEFNNE